MSEESNILQMKEELKKLKFQRKMMQSCNPEADGLDRQISRLKRKINEQS